MKDKKYFVLFGLLLCAGLCFGNGKINSSDKSSIKYVSSRWFDIIYWETCEKSAAVLYENADKIYQDLADMYGWKEPPVRMPVVLTQDVEIFNAYFTNGYYNHIVLYVTSPIEEVNYQEDTFLMTFKHELTHAFTYNMKNVFWKTIGTIFCDFYSFAALTITPGFAEGATLTSESYTGNGRLNDEFAKHTVKQAKIENKFPKFSDVQGSRDIYPSGSFYFFNGAFHEYLQKTYGMEKYARFWYNCVNNSLFISWAFNKAYNMSLNKAWSDFKKTYYIPEVSENPVASGLAKDFFVSNSKYYSLNNNIGALYSGLSLSDKGLTYFDSYSDNVYFVSNEELSLNKIKPKKLFQLLNINSSMQSKDGRFIASSYYANGFDNPESKIAVYDTESKYLYKPSYHGVRNACVVKAENEYYLCVLKFAGEDSCIEISKLLFTGGKISGEEKVSAVDFNRLQYASNFFDCGNGTVGYLLKEKTSYSIEFVSINGTKCGSYKIPEVDSSLPKFIMRYLSPAYNAEGEVEEIYFSWVEKNSMPRLGKFNLNEKEFVLSTQNLSGGIFEPVYVNGQIIYIGNFYEQNRILMLSNAFADEIKFSSVENGNTEENKFDLNEEAAVIAEESELFVKKFAGEDESSLSFNDAEIKKYSMFKFFRGGLVPVSVVQSKSFDSEHKGKNYALPIGMSYFVNNPYDSKIFQFSAGYGTETNSFGMLAALTGKTFSENFTYSISGQLEFDILGAKTGDVEGSASFYLPAGKKSAFILSVSDAVHVGRSNASDSELEAIYSKDKDGNFKFADFKESVGAFGSKTTNAYLYNGFSMPVYYSTMTRAGNTRYSKAGILAGIAPVVDFSYEISNSQIDYVTGDISFYVKGNIPRLIPVDCVKGLTYNLPVKLYANIFSTESVAPGFVKLPSYPDLAFASAEVVLFAWEVQKAMPVFTFLYFNDFRLSLSGCVGFNYTESESDNKSFGISRVKNYADEIIAGENPLEWSVALNFTAGLNALNIGGGARSSNKNYITSSFYFSSKSVKPHVGFGVDVNF